MKKNFSIPITFILIFLISKEVFSYDSEKIVILCILSFILIVYFNFKDILYQVFISKSSKLREEFKELLSLRRKFEREIIDFWKLFKKFAAILYSMKEWIEPFWLSFLNNANKSRKLIVFHIIKDQLNLLVKDQLKINQNLNLFLIKNSINNLRLVFLNKIQYETTGINNLNVYFDKLIQSSTNINLIHLILNKLNINKEFYLTSNKTWTNFNNYIYTVIINKF